MRIGPQMERAVSIVAANPGCTMRFVAVRLHRAAANGKNNALGYNPVHRCLRAGLVRNVSTNRHVYKLEVV